MNVRSIIGMFKNASLIHTKPVLGRWNIHNYRQTALKIKYANEDNCGISFYNYTNQKQTKTTDMDDTNYMYIMGYESAHD